ncbi:Neurobeachin-like protein 2, partial [Kappamyces sp. JEL0680]
MWTSLYGLKTLLSSETFKAENDKESKGQLAIREHSERPAIPRQNENRKLTYQNRAVDLTEADLQHSRQRIAQLLKVEHSPEAAVDATQQWSALLMASRLLEIQGRGSETLAQQDLLLVESILTRCHDALVDSKTSETDLRWIQSILSNLEEVISKAETASRKWTKAIRGSLDLSRHSGPPPSSTEFGPVVSSALALVQRLPSGCPSGWLSCLHIVGICIAHDPALLELLNSPSDAALLLDTLKSTTCVPLKCLCLHFLDCLAVVHPAGFEKSFLTGVHSFEVYLLHLSGNELFECAELSRFPIPDVEPLDLGVFGVYRLSIEKRSSVAYVVTNYLIHRSTILTNGRTMRILRHVFISAMDTPAQSELHFLMALYASIRASSDPAQFALQMMANEQFQQLWDRVIEMASSSDGDVSVQNLSMIVVALCLSLSPNVVRCMQLLMKSFIIRIQTSGESFQLLCSLIFLCLERCWRQIDVECRSGIVAAVTAAAPFVTQDTARSYYLLLGFLTKHLLSVEDSQSSTKVLMALFQISGGQYVFESLKICLGSCDSIELATALMQKVHAKLESKDAPFAKSFELFLRAKPKYQTVFIAAIQNVGLVPLLLGRFEGLRSFSDWDNAMLALLQALLCFDDALADQFAELHGFERILELCIDVDDFDPYFRVAFNEFQVVHFRGLLLFQHMERISCKWVCDFFQRLASISRPPFYLNLQKCQRFGVFSSLMKHFDYLVSVDLVDLLISFATTMLRYHCSFKDAKLLVSTLKALELKSVGATSNYKLIPWHHDIIIRFMTNAVENPDPVRSYFVCHDDTSCFQFPPINSKRIGSKTSYTVWLLFKVFGSIEHSRILFRLASATRQEFVQLVLEEGSFFFESSQRKTKLGEVGVGPGQWVQVCFQHSRGMFDVSNETLYKDGQVIFKGNAVHPNILSDDLTFHVGKHGYGNNLQLLYSSVALFFTTLSPELINTLNYSRDTPLPFPLDLYHFQLLPYDQQPYFFCHPLSPLNISSNTNTPREVNYSKIALINTRSLPDALQAAGSLEILYPLITQVGIPIAPPPKELPASYCLSGNERLVLILRFLKSVILASGFHRINFTSTKGPKLLSLLLQKVKPEYISVDVFDIFQDMKVLRQMIDENILLEPQLWSITSLKVREEYFTRIKSLHFFLATDRITFWLDSIEHFFSGNGEDEDFAEAWDYFYELVMSAGNDVNEERLVESLWCCIHSPGGFSLYRIFFDLSKFNRKTFGSIIESHGIDLLFRFLQSIHEPVRMVSLKLLQDLYFNPAFPKIVQSINETPASVWVELIGSTMSSFEVYAILLSLIFNTNYGTVYSSINMQEVSIVNGTFVAVLFEAVSVCLHPPGPMELALIRDWIAFIDSDHGHGMSFSRFVSFSTLMDVFARYITNNVSVHSEAFRSLVALFVSYVLLQENLSDCLTKIIVQLHLLYENDIATLLFSIILDELLSRLLMAGGGTTPQSDSARQRVNEMLCTVDEYLFNHKDIYLAFQNTYGSLLGDYGQLMDNESEPSGGRSRRPSSAPDMIFQKCYPFEEFTFAALKYARLVNSLLRSEATPASKFYAFPLHIPRDRLVVIAIRIILASFTVYDKALWKETLSQLRDMMDGGDFSKEMISLKYANYIVGSLVDAKKIDADKLLDSIIWQSLELWGKFFVSEKLLDRESLQEALSSTENLSSFLETSCFQNIYNQALYPATREVENDWINSAGKVVERYLTASKSFLQDSVKSRNARLAHVGKVHSRLNGKTQAFADSRKSRLSRRLDAYEREKVEIVQLWLLSLQEVSFERRLWNNPQQQEFLKLSIVENKYRMRLRLVRNIYGVDHRDAASRRDRIALSPSLTPALTYESLPDRQKILNSRIQRVQLETGLAPATRSVPQPPATQAASTTKPYPSQHETCLITFECDFIHYLVPLPGRIEVTNTHLRFYPDQPSFTDSSTHTVNIQDARAFTDHLRPLEALSKLFFRRYKMRNSAFEAFFSDGDSFFFNLRGRSSEVEKNRKKLVGVLQGLNLQSFEPCFSGSDIANSLAALTSQWKERQISNFEYIMALNTYSGRSYNDLAQYPVFPWVIADYRSATLDLSDPGTFRDLSKPMGAIYEPRLKKFEERLEALKEDPTQFPFLYGTHYSSASSVLFYMVRVEPYTSLHISLQGGKFDHADRQFHSMASLWESVTMNSGDVKELIPEFYCFPDFLRNLNNFDLGKTQAGDVLRD